MSDSTYWKNIVNSLADESKANWAAHVLASNIEITDEILLFIDKAILIRNCLLCYGVDFSAQPYLDEVLSNFSVQELGPVVNSTMLGTIRRFFVLRCSHITTYAALRCSKISVFCLSLAN